MQVWTRLYDSRWTTRLTTRSVGLALDYSYDRALVTISPRSRVSMREHYRSRVEHMDKQAGYDLCFHCGEDLRQSDWAAGTYHGHKFEKGGNFGPPSEEYVQSLDSNNDVPRITPYFQQLNLNLWMITNAREIGHFRTRDCWEDKCDLCFDVRMTHCEFELTHYAEDGEEEIPAQELDQIAYPSQNISLVATLSGHCNKPSCMHANKGQYAADTDAGFTVRHLLECIAAHRMEQENYSASIGMGLDLNHSFMECGLQMVPNGGYCVGFWGS